VWGMYNLLQTQAAETSAAVHKGLIARQSE
jgi:hypothetical protein